VVQEASRQADLVAKQIYAQASRVVSRATGGNVGQALRRDQELQALLDASVGYSPHLLFALIVDRSGTVILHTDRDREGVVAPTPPSLTGLINLDSISRFAALYRGARIYETTLPLLLNGQPFGSIQLGISTTLVSQELTAAVKHSMILAVIALPLAWLAAMWLAGRILGPIRMLASGGGRLRRGGVPAGRGV